MNASRETTDVSSVLFYYSSTPFLITNVLLLIVFIPVLLVFILEDALLLSLFFLILDLIYIGSILRLCTYRVRKAQFFDDHFEVRGRDINKRVEYKKIGQVQRVSAVPIFANRTQIRIDLADDAPITIPGNPGNRKLKVDLYSWLSKRIQSKDFARTI